MLCVFLHGTIIFIICLRLQKCYFELVGDLLDSVATYNKTNLEKEEGRTPERMGGGLTSRD